jgi:ABC-2 type transport system permease protein
MYFPLTGAFITPIFLIIGKITLLEGVISELILIATAAVLFIMGGGVYEGMILYQGQRLKFRDIVKIAIKGNK